MTKPKPACQELLAWLRFRHKKSALEQLSDEALLTLQAEAHLMALWARGDAAARGAVQLALPLVLQRFPAACVALAQDAIAQANDWPDIPRLWPWTETAAPGAAGRPMVEVPDPDHEGGQRRVRLLPPPQAAPLVRRVGARSTLCAPQCVVGYRHLVAQGHSLAPLTGQDQSALSAVMHVKVLIAYAAPAVRDDLQAALAALLPAMQSKVRPLVEDLPRWESTREEGA